MHPSLSRLPAAICLCMGALASHAWAAQANLHVSATVSEACLFDNSDYFLDFGNLDPISASDAIVSTTLRYQCTNGSKATSLLMQGGQSSPFNGTLTHASSAATLPISISWQTPSTPGSGIGFSLPHIPVLLTGTIPGASIQVAPYGAYTALYTLELLP